jgi:hypothetical protein
LLLTTAIAQDKSQPVASPPSTCTRDAALDIVQQLIDLSKTIDKDEQRITVLLRAADVIWPYQQEKARATFSDAFEIATRYYKESGDNPRNEGRLIVGVPDQRYTVITAIAKRDSAWARKLSKQILEDEAREAEEKAAKDSAKDSRVGEKLLGTASSLLSSDLATALAFARTSLNYRATISLPFFLFKLSEIDRAAADQFYREALAAYAAAPMDQFLYLSSYPFAARREIGEMPAWSFYAVPATLTPNPLLQRLFVQTLFARARDLIQNPVGPKQGARFSEASQIFMALSRLETLIAPSLTDLTSSLLELDWNVFSLLSQQEQQRTGESLTEPPKKSFDESIEAADRYADASRRESAIALAILSAAETEGLEKLEAASLKLDDLALRSQVMSLVYFYRAQRATREKKLEEARRLAAKVEEPDQRAYLYAQIANDSLKQTKNDADAREMLEDVLNAVARAPHSEIKARAMLVVVHLYSTIDPSRAVAVLGDVVKTVNHVESIDLSSDIIRKRIEGKSFGYYRMLQTPGFSPETVFRSMGKLDFDGTLYLASNLENKFLRAMTSLAVVDQCLKDLTAAPKPKKAVTPKP